MLEGREGMFLESTPSRGGNFSTLGNKVHQVAECSRWRQGQVPSCSSQCITPNVDEDTALGRGGCWGL